MTTSLGISALTFLAIFGGALGGLWLASRLPEPHLGNESRTAISVSMAVVGTLSALVLSLLISNANTSFNTKAAAVESLAVNIVKLDHILIQAGTGMADVRRTLQAYAAAKTRELSGRDSRPDSDGRTLAMLEQIRDGILDLHPTNARDNLNQARALTLVDAITDARWTLAETAGSTIPQTFLFVLVFWLSLLFTSFGLFAPRNQTVLIALLLSALAVTGGIFIILELGSPNSGFIRVSDAPIDWAVQQITRPGE